MFVMRNGVRCEMPDPKPAVPTMVPMVIVETQSQPVAHNPQIPTDYLELKQMAARLGVGGNGKAHDLRSRIEAKLAQAGSLA